MKSKTTASITEQESCRRERIWTWESWEVRKSWSWVSEAKEQQSTLAEAKEKRLVKLDSNVRITELGLKSLVLDIGLRSTGGGVVTSAIDAN